MELEVLAQALEFRIKCVPVSHGRVSVFGAEVEEHRAVDFVGHGERGVSRSPVTHYVSAVERHRAFEDLVAGGHEPSDAPPHAEACYANAVVVDGRVGGEEVYRGVHVGDDVRIFQVA